MPATAEFRLRPQKAWHYNHVTFTPIAKTFMLYCRLIYMLPMLYVRLTIKVKVGIPESFKVRWDPHKITGSSHLKHTLSLHIPLISHSQCFPPASVYFPHILSLLLDTSSANCCALKSITMMNLTFSQSRFVA